MPYTLRLVGGNDPNQPRPFRMIGSSDTVNAFGMLIPRYLWNYVPNVGWIIRIIS